MFKKLEGYKTYGFAAAVVLCGVVDTLNFYCGTDLKGCGWLPQVPPFVYPLLGSAVVWARSVAKTKQ